MVLCDIVRVFKKNCFHFYLTFNKERLSTCINIKIIVLPFNLHHRQNKHIYLRILFYKWSVMICNIVVNFISNPDSDMAFNNIL